MQKSVRFTVRPWSPKPIKPKATRLLGATAPSAPIAEAGIIAGKLASAAAFLRKVRRESG
jgi:hypothetical protein